MNVCKRLYFTFRGVFVTKVYKEKVNAQFSSRAKLYISKVG